MHELAPLNRAADARTSMPAARENGSPLQFPPEEWHRLLARQAALYTNLQSSSVPVETAAELMESMLFCVRTAWEAGFRPDSDRPLADWLLAGQRILAQRHHAGLRLQKAALSACLPLDNAVYREVLAETRRFFTWYDIRFLAHQIPCMIDYPPCLPVDDGLRGVDYINEFLRRRLWEDEFCGHFPLPRLEAVLARRPELAVLGELLASLPQPEVQPA